MIIFKGTNLASVGIINDTIPKIQKPKKRIDTYEIFGRNGFLSVDNGTYDSWQLSVECHCPDTADMNYIASLLDGYGTISFDNLKQSTAIVNSNIEFEQIRNSGFKKFLLELLVNPIFEDITPTQTSNLSSQFELDGAYQKLIFTSNSTFRTYPDEIEIEISADTTFYFGGNSFSLKAGHYFLDCKAKEIVDNDGDNMSSKMSGDFPYLETQTTILATTLPTTFKIKYRKTYLVG